MSDVRVERVGAERLDDVEPLWVALEQHHAELSGVPPVRPLSESWRRRRGQYERWLAADAAHLLLASRDGRAIGYLMLRVGDGPPTWDVGERVAEVETMSVLPGDRSSGVGRALMDEALRLAAAEGATAVGVGVAHSNAAARRFYERAGFEPFYVELLRIDR